jgi:hypothetical protein
LWTIPKSLILTCKQSDEYEGRPSRRKGDEVEGFNLTETRLSSRLRFFDDFLDENERNKIKNLETVKPALG